MPRQFLSRGVKPLPLRNAMMMIGWGREWTCEMPRGLPRGYLLCGLGIDL